MRVCPVSESLLTTNVGSSSARRCSAMESFSWSALLLGSMLIDITVSGNVGGSRRTSWSRSHRVSPVTMSFAPIMAHIEPLYASSISSRLSALMISRREMRSDLRERGLYTVMPFLRQPVYTRTNMSFPTNGSLQSLKAKAVGGAKSSGTISRDGVSSSPSAKALIGGTSSGEGR